MPFLEYMPQYFAGEKAIGYYAIPIGLVTICIAASIYWFYWSNHLARGLFYPLLLVGLVAVGVGGGMYVKSQGDIVRLTIAHEARPLETVQAEVERMAKVNANWMHLKAVWTVLILVGMGVVFGVKHETWEGVALGLLLIGALGFVVDHTAERRALIYAQQLQVSAQNAGR